MAGQVSDKDTAEADEPSAVQAAPPITCPNCGALVQGKFCSECGASLTDTSASAYLLFVDSFFKIGELRRYGGVYLRIVRSPTSATRSSTRRSRTPRL